MKLIENLQSNKVIGRFLNRETISYVIFGILTTIIGFGVYSLCVYWGLKTIAANTISTVLAVIFAYVTNKAFVFRSRSWKPAALLPEFAKFCGARVATYIMETALLYLLVDVLELNSMLMKALTTVLVVAANYVLSKWMVFAGK